MKTNSLVIFLVIPFFSYAQVPWNQTGDNNTSGKILIGGNASSGDSYDLVIDRNKPNTGIKIFNADLTGRSLLLFGNNYGGKYGYLAHHAQSHNAGTGYSETHKPSSTVLVGADVNGLGLISTSDIRFSAGGSEDSKQRMVISSGGNIGIGTLTPAARLHVAGSIFSNATRTNTVFNGSPNADNANFIGSEGYWALRTATDNSYNLDVYNGASPVAAMTVLQNGHVGMGTIHPGDYRLAVEGKIGAREIVVTTTSFADYVFEDQYKLMSIADVASFIKKNKHLPNVPTAKEVTQNGGVNVGDMQVKLLEKVEELTLYLIEQDKKVEAYHQENIALRKEIKQLK